MNEEEIGHWKNLKITSLAQTSQTRQDIIHWNSLQFSISKVDIMGISSQQKKIAMCTPLLQFSVYGADGLDVKA